MSGFGDRHALERTRENFLLLHFCDLLRPSRILNLLTFAPLHEIFSVFAIFPYCANRIALQRSLPEIFSQHDKVTVGILNNNLSFTSFPVAVPSPYMARTGIDRHSQILQAGDDWID
jgi:hypothetical protein